MPTPSGENDCIETENIVLAVTHDILGESKQNQRKLKRFLKYRVLWLSFFSSFLKMLDVLYTY